MKAAGETRQLQYAICHHMKQNLHKTCMGDAKEDKEGQPKVKMFDLSVGRGAAKLACQDR
jgi:hypothetical protein